MVQVRTTSPLLDTRAEDGGDYACLNSVLAQPIRGEAAVWWSTFLLSYNREDESRVPPLVQALKVAGLAIGGTASLRERKAAEPTSRLSSIKPSASSSAGLSAAQARQVTSFVTKRDGRNKEMRSFRSCLSGPRRSRWGPRDRRIH